MLFDVLNSKSPFAKGAKCGITKVNLAEKKSFLLNMRSYLLKLKLSDGVPLYETRRYFI